MSTPLNPKHVPGSSAKAELALDCAHLLDTLPDGIILFDRDWRFLYANNEAIRISRLPDEYIGKVFWELYPDVAGTEREEIYRRSMDERLALEYVFYHRGVEMWIELKTLPIPSGLAVYFRDVSRLHAAEEGRDFSIRTLQQVFDVTTDGILFLDRNYNISFLNEQAAESLSAAGDLIGKNLWEAFPATAVEGSPFRYHYPRAMDEGIPARFESYYPEPLNLWFSVDVRPAEDGIVLFFRDITAQRAAADELERRRELAERQSAEIETVYRTAPIGLALFDTKDFRYLRLNDRQAAFFGLKPEEIVGRTLTEMAPIEGLRELFEQVANGTPVINYPLEGSLISDPDNHRYWTVNYFPVYAPDGSIQAISAASLEVTAQKRVENALLQSEKLAAVGRMASSISHEINNPLESVTNLLYLMGTQPELSATSHEYVEMAQAELARVTQIATQTLRFHRQSARPTPTTAAQMIEPVLALYRHRLDNSGITLSAEFDSNTPILCLENELRQVFANLVSNAMDAMRTGGHLLLRAHDARDHITGERGVRITIADTGHGMSEATKARIYEPFFTTKELNGTGLGLWISAEIIQRHKGRLTVRSSQDERLHGTIFSLFLPVSQDA